MACRGHISRPGLRLARLQGGMMDTNDQLSALFAAALEQQEAAKAAVADLAQERKALGAAVEAIKNASSSLQSATGSAASKAVTESRPGAKISCDSLKHGHRGIDRSRRQG